MSRRIRSIKPELLEDEKTAGLSDTAFRLFIGLITMADDFGTFRADARFVEKQIYWLAVPELGVATALEEIASTGMVTYYVVRGQRYGAFTNWGKHQRVDNAGRRGGLLPAPEDADNLAASRRESRRDENLMRELAAGSGSGSGSDLEGSGEESSAAAPDVGEDPRPSEVRQKSAPPIAMPGGDPEIRAVADAIRSEKRLQTIHHDAYGAAEHAMPVNGRKSFEAYREAVHDAAGDTEMGELSSVTLSRVRRYLKNAKRAKVEANAPAHKDFDFEPGELGPARARKRITAQDAPPLDGWTGTGPQRAFAEAIVNGLGKLPSQPLTEAERDAKRLADKQRLAEMDEAAERKAGAG